MTWEFQTCKGVVNQVFKTLGSGCVIHHEPTVKNTLGQSGVHTFIDDVIDIILSSANEADAYKRIYKYLAAGTEG